MERKHGQLARKSQFFILNHDQTIQVNNSLESVLAHSASGQRNILKGTLLELTPAKPRPGPFPRIVVRSLDNESFEFECSEAHVSPITTIEKDLLIAIASRKDRYHVYMNNSEVLSLGVIAEIGDLVYVRIKGQDSTFDAAGTIRYKGELPGQQGTQFGVELKEYRGCGVTNGEFRKHKYFSCEEDCGVFVPINKLKQCINQPKEEWRYSKGTSFHDEEAGLSPSEICRGQTVCIFTEAGRKEGTVLYCGRPPKATSKFVGIEMFDIVDARDRNDGTYQGDVIFNPRYVNRTLLVPKESVFPVGSLVPERESSAFDFSQGEGSFNDSKGWARRGAGDGRVKQSRGPQGDIQPLHGLEVDAVSEHIRNGAFTQERVTHGDYGNTSGYARCLSSETVKDSMTPDRPDRGLNLVSGIMGSPGSSGMTRFQAASSQDLNADPLLDDFECVHHRDHSDFNMEDMYEAPKPQSAPVRTMHVPGHAVPSSELEGRGRHVKPASTGQIHQKYGEKPSTPPGRTNAASLTSPVKPTASVATTRVTSSSSTQLRAAERQFPHWTTSKFPNNARAGRLKKKEVAGRSATEGSRSNRKARAKGQAVVGPEHGRVVSEFTLSDGFLQAVAAMVKGKWKALAENLCLTNQEMATITGDNDTARECALDMLGRWRDQMSSSRDKLGPLIKACRKSDLKAVASDLEQGLDEQMLHLVAEQVDESVWSVLGQNLGLDRDHLVRLQMEDQLPRQRVYNMLLDWRLLQDVHTDKQLALSMALGSIGMEELALEVCRGITADLLDYLSRNAAGFWKRLGGELGLHKTVLNEITETSRDDESAARRVFQEWKRSQESEGDLLGPLAKALENCGRPHMASHVVKGLDDSLLEVLAPMIDSFQHDMATSLGIPLQTQSGHNDSQHGEAPSTLRLLKWWRAHRVINEAQGQHKLYIALTKNRLRGAAELVKTMMNPLSSSSSSSSPRVAMYRGREEVEEEVWRKQNQPLKPPTPSDLNDDSILISVANGAVSSKDLAEALEIPTDYVERIKTSRHDLNKQKFCWLKEWRELNRTLYHGNNQSWQLCKILLQLNATAAANFIVPDAISHRDWFLDTDFETYDETQDLDYHLRHPPSSSSYQHHHPHPLPVQPTGYATDVIAVDRSPEVQGLGLGVDSVVEVKIRGQSHYGVIRWMGRVKNWLDDNMVGIELEEMIEGGMDGTFEGTRFFVCPAGKGIFVYLSQCRPDSRFPTGADTYRVYRRETSLDFGNMESPIVTGYVEPQAFSPDSVGENKGIQGDQNSCYLDVTLYSMYSFNRTFDHLLQRPAVDEDLKEFELIQKILREKIVNPLRQFGFVRADRVRDLRVRLDQLGMLSGMTNEEKDPEELLHMLVRDVLKSQPLITTRHGDTAETDNQFLYQIFMERNDSLELPRVEQLLHQSFLDNELKLVTIPECLIVQMPRFGKDYKMYRRILPSLSIDITDLLENYPRECTICGELALRECRDCRSDQNISEQFIKSYCIACCDLAHCNVTDHRVKDLMLSPDVKTGIEMIQKVQGESIAIKRQTMELFAVVCIQTSHYVTFVKTDSNPSQWVFFDSMADRDASSVPGFNIPKVTHLKDFEAWLSSPKKIIAHPDDKQLPEHLRRLLGDAYICFYRRQGADTSRTRPREWSTGATNF